MEQLIEKAITAHQVWTEKFEADLADSTVPEHFEIASYDDLCDVGKWLYGLDDEVKHQPDYRKVKNLHHDFHSVAGEIVQLMKLKQFKAARELLDGEYLAITTELQSALRAWQDAVREQKQTA